MASPKNEVIQMEYHNPHASMPLFVPVLVICNTPDEDLERNITINTKKDLRWLKSVKAHDGVAVLVGGGPSVVDDIEKIAQLKQNGATVFAMNAASQMLRDNDIEVDYQCIVDAKPETKNLIDYSAKNHLIGSQVHPETMDSISDPVVCHLEIGEIERFFPEKKVNRGGYVLLGGGASVGNTALCMAYALGFRELHIFGYDSCHKNGKSHAYPQDMNIFIPTTEVKWMDKTYTASVAMKSQAERFIYTASGLKKLGCHINVYGEGLLQSMYNAKYEDLTEREKYQLMWQFDSYREGSPGERIADFYLDTFEPKGLVIDFGCGTGRGSLVISQRNPVILIDFADNCRNEEAQSLPFIQWDLTKALPITAPNGFCTDVMEHIPTEDVEGVIKNIMASAKEVFFQISTVDDVMGDLIDEPLHLTVKPHSWWKDLFVKNGYHIQYDREDDAVSIFYVDSFLWHNYGNPV